MADEQRAGKQKSKRYCIRCGSELEDGARFCTACGNPVEATPESGPQDRLDDGTDKQPDEKIGTVPAGGADVGAHPDPTPRPLDAGQTLIRPAVQNLGASSISEPSETRQPSTSGRRPSKRTVIAAAIAAIVLVALVGAGVVLALGMRGTSASGNGAHHPAVSGPPKPVKLKYSYTTMYAGDESDYPSFTFSYPGGWGVSENTLTKSGEKVTLSNDAGVRICFRHLNPASDALNQPASHLKIKKIASADFEPGFVRGTSYRNLGSFVVAKIDGRTGNSIAGSQNDGTASCYALVPRRAIADSSVVAMNATVPSFEYADAISFYCLVPKGGVSKSVERQIAAILGSLVVDSDTGAKTVPSPEAPDTPETDGPSGESRSAYLLPDSATHYYSEDELQDFSTEDLFLARNEIYARHGRIFKNETLNSYFRQKSWYRPSVSPDDFSTSVLNDCELKNLDVIRQVEVERNSPHVK